MTGVATFLSLAFFYCMSVSGYVSRGSIEVDVVQTPEAIESFRKCVRSASAHVLKPENIRRHISVGEGSLVSSHLQQLASGDDLKQRFHLSISDAATRGRTHINMAFVGRGTDAEQNLVNALTTEIAKHLLSISQTSMSLANSSPESSRSQGTSRARQLESSATALFNQISVGQDVDAASSGAVQHVDAFPSTGSAPFRTVSNTVQTTPNSAAAFPAQAHIATHISTVEKLRNTVGELATLAGEQEMKSGSSQSIAFTVEGVSARSSLPADGIPQLPLVLSLAMVAGLAASVVTICYRPFDDAGFESVSTMKSVLGVPVVATLTRPATAEPPSVHSTLNRFGKSSPSQPPVFWANQVVRVAELILFSATLVVLGVCILNADIRAAFSENLFHGMARIIWMFKG